MKKFIFLAKNIINKKINIKISYEYKRILTKMAKNKMQSKDLKILICEDQGISTIFERVIKIISKKQNVTN